MTSVHVPVVTCAILAVTLLAPVRALASEVSVAGEIQGAGYPRDAANGAARAGDVRGWGTLEVEEILDGAVEIDADLTIYVPHDDGVIVDGRAALFWRRAQLELAAGLLRESWGRLERSELDALGPVNRAFSLVAPELRLSQPTVRATLVLGGLTVDVSTLVGWRAQPVPAADARFGFGVPAVQRVDPGRLGRQAVALRVSGTELNVDWSIHAFQGLSRRPTFVPRLDAEHVLRSIDAVYTETLQIGGALETAVADWRLVAEGFSRRGGLDITGRKDDYGFLALAAEYQRFGAFDGAYDVIPRLQITVDTRGDRADLPFGSSIHAAVRVADTGLLPLELEASYLYDWTLGGQGVVVSAERTLVEAPALTAGVRLTTFTGGDALSVLDIWEQDLEIYGYLRMEI